MIDDDRLLESLREARPPIGNEAARRDTWPLLSSRLDEGARWSLIDAALGAAATLAMLLFPEGLWLLAFHL